MSAVTRVCLPFTLLVSLFVTEFLHSQAAPPIRATPLQRIPAGAVPLRAVQKPIPPSLAAMNPFPPLPSNHFIGQACNGCHDPEFMAAFKASLNSHVADTAIPTLPQPVRTTNTLSITQLLQNTSLSRPRTIEAVLQARRDLAFGGLKQMPAADASELKQRTARAERIAHQIRSGNWSGYQEELDACGDEARAVHEKCVSLLAQKDQAMLPEEVLDLATVNLPAVENSPTEPVAIESVAAPVAIIPGGDIDPEEFPVTSTDPRGSSGGQRLAVTPVPVIPQGATVAGLVPQGATAARLISPGAMVVIDSSEHLPPSDSGGATSLTEAPPGEEISDQLLQAYATLLQKAATRGSTRTFLQRLEKGVGDYGGTDPEHRARACDLLVGAGMHAEAKPYLDPLPAEGEADAQLRIRHGQYHLAIASSGTDLKERRQHQTRAADLFSSVAEDALAETTDRKRSVTLLAGLLPSLSHAWTSDWRKRVFSGSGEVGMALLAQLGTEARKQIQTRSSIPAFRLKTLQAIRIAIGTLFDQIGDDIGPWQASIDALAIAFSDEANLSLGRAVALPSNRRASQLIKPRDLVEATPDKRWLQAIAPSLRQGCALATIACAARADEPDRAMEVLSALADDPSVDISKLASVLIAEWSRNLDPNRPDDQFFENRVITSTGVFISSFGGQRSAPLTRSKQRRSLRHLGEVVAELKKLGVPDLDWSTLVNAFASSHSQAEVYREQDIEELFGPIDQLPAEVAEELASKMWRQLQRNWRNPEIQQARGTRRTTSELQEEVERGYHLGLRLTSLAMENAPNSWQAPMLAGNLRFDLAEYWHELDPDLERYVPQRESAFTRYADSVRIYSEQFNAGKEHRVIGPYLQWFISALGATELGFLTMTTKPENDQVGLLAGSFSALPPEEQLLHRGLFASAVESSVGGVKADLKSRFVRHAMRIIGDHPLGRGTRRLARLYEDLGSEVELMVSIDGSNEVGTDPFGVRVALRFTDALQRESGGFDLYLRNQVYVRLAPQPMDYRDDFEARIRESFDEHFVIESLQFNNPDSKPYSFDRSGWMEQAFAYLILRAKDRSVDLLPEVRIDLDFHDGTNGSVRVPVVSPVLPILATSSSGPRPTAGASSVEIALDGRELESGKLKLEVLAQGLGVLPDLDGILPGWEKQITDAGYLLQEIDGLLDNGLNVVKIEPEILPIVPESERSWTINLQTTETIAASAVFNFPRSADGTELICKKYEDFDIVTLEEPMATLQIPRTGLPEWLVMTIGAFIALFVVTLMNRNKKVTVEEEPRWKMPEEVSPLSVAHLLRSIEAEKALIDTDQLAALREEVVSIETRYFSASGDSQIDVSALKETAQQWLNRSRN